MSDLSDALRGIQQEEADRARQQAASQAESERQDNVNRILCQENARQFIELMRANGIEPVQTCRMRIVPLKKPSKWASAEQVRDWLKVKAWLISYIEDEGTEYESRITFAVMTTGEVTGCSVEKHKGSTIIVLGNNAGVTPSRLTDIRVFAESASECIKRQSAAW